MKKQKLENSLRALKRQPLLDADLDAAEARVWSKIKAKTQQQVSAKPSFNWYSLFNDINYKAYVPAAALAVIMMGIAGYVLIVGVPNGSPVVSYNSQNVHSLNSLPEVLKEKEGLTPNKANLPTVQPSPTTSPSSPADNDSLEDEIALSSSIYNYTITAPTTTVSGIREVPSVSKSNFIQLINKANAGTVTRYPVIYDIRYRTSGNNTYAIEEINIFTGRRQDVVTAPSGKWISFLDYNQQHQVLVYNLPTGEKTHDAYGNEVSLHDIHLYFLNTKEDRVIAHSIVPYRALWSPDGRYVAFTTDCNFTRRTLYFYDLDQSRLSSFTMPSTSERNADGWYMYYNFELTEYSWMDNNQGIIGNLDGMSPNASDKHIYSFIAKVDLRGNFSNIESSINRSGAISGAVISVQGAIWGITGDVPWPTDKDPIDMHGPTYLQPSEYGWLFNYQSDGAKHDYRQAMGEYYRDWMVSRNGLTAVYSNTKMLDSNNVNKMMQIYVLDVANKTSKALNSPNDSRTRIIGWNGNEKNLLLWNTADTFYNLNIVTNKLTRIRVH